MGFAVLWQHAATTLQNL